MSKTIPAGVDMGTQTGVYNTEEELRARHAELKAHLQELYGGEAPQYMHTRRDNRQLFPPIGMCPSDVYTKMVDMYAEQVQKHKDTIARMEAQLPPYTPSYSPHPMIRLAPSMQPNPNRERLVHEIAAAHGHVLVAQEHLSFWTQHVKPASPAYLAQLAALFDEKERVRTELLERFQSYVPPW